MEDKPSLLSEFLRIYNTGNDNKEFDAVSLVQGVCRTRRVTVDTSTNNGKITLQDVYGTIVKESSKRNVVVNKTYDTDNVSLLRLALASSYRIFITITIMSQLDTAEINTDIVMAFDDNAEIVAFSAVTLWIRTA